MIHVRGDGGRRTTPFALPIIPSCLLFLFNLLGRIVSRGSQWGVGFYGYRLKFWLFNGYRLIFSSYG